LADLPRVNTFHRGIWTDRPLDRHFYIGGVEHDEQRVAA
jgi:hypothetical protein